MDAPARYLHPGVPVIRPATYRPICHQNYQLQPYISPVPDPLVWAVDTFRTGLKAYAFLPPVLLTRVLQNQKHMKSITAFDCALVAGLELIRGYSRPHQSQPFLTSRVATPTGKSPQSVATPSKFLLHTWHRRNLLGVSLGLKC